MLRRVLLSLLGLALAASSAVALEIPPTFLTFIYTDSKVLQFSQTSAGDVLVPLMDKGVVAVLSTNGITRRTFGSFGAPTGVAVDATGNIFICDQLASRIYKYSPALVELASFGGHGSGPGQLIQPTNCSVSYDQTRLYVTELRNHRVSVFDLNGNFLSAFGTRGSGPGQFESPIAIVVEPGTGDLFITNQGNHRVDHFSSAGAYLFSFGQAGSGPDDFNLCVGLCMDRDHNLWVTDQLNNRVKKTTRDGVLLTSWGTLGRSDPGQFWNPWSVFRTEDGTVWVGDTNNRRLQLFGDHPLAARRTSWGELKQRFR